MYIEDRYEAIEILRDFQGEVIEDIYDDFEDVQDAIFFLDPEFEYPDWSHKTIRDFLLDFDNNI